MKLPTIAGIAATIVLVAVFIFGFERISRQSLTATGSTQPANVRITNVGDARFTLSWTTEKDATGALIVEGTGRQRLTFLDERDISGALEKYTTHSITPTGLQPNTQYEVTILSNGRSYLNDDEPFLVRTGPSLPPNATHTAPAYG